MLGFLFGFNARLGRLHFFLATIALAVVMTAICFAIAGYLFRTKTGGTFPDAALMTWPVIAGGLGFALATFTLQSMRIRDIGWDPVCVIPAWIAILIVDKLIAVKFPAWSFDPEHHATVVGALVNLGLMLALMFWPGGDFESAAPSYGERPGKPDKRPPARQAGSVLEDRLTRATGGGSSGRVF